MPDSTDNILSLNLTPITAERILKEIVKDSSNVKITYHAEVRMTQRGITRPQILRCLKNGRITEGPYKDTHGNWRMNVEIFSAGEPLTVVAVLDNKGNGNYAIVITAYIG